MAPRPERQDLDDRFERLFEAHAGYVYGSLRRLGVAERDLEDLSQDVFVAVHHAIDTFDPDRPAKPWLMAFCHRLASNYRRLARHRVDLTGDHGSEPTGTPSPEEAVSAAQTRSRLAAALDVLSDEHRAVFVMHDVDGMSAPEIAKIVGIPVNTAYSRIRLARRSVESILRDGEERDGEP